MAHDTLEIHDLNLDADDKSELVDYIVKELDKAKEWRKPWEDKWEVWERQYNSRLRREDVGPEQSRLDYPTTREFCKQISARLLNPIFQQSPIFVAVARKPDLQDAAKVYEDVLDYVTDRARFMQFCDSLITQAQIYPVAVAKVGWTMDKRYVRDWGEEFAGTEEDEQGNLISIFGRAEVEREVVERVGSFPEVVPCEDFFFEMGAASVKDAAWVAHRVWLTKEQLERRVDDGVYDEEAFEAMGEPTAYRNKVQRWAAEGYGVSLNARDKDRELYEVYEVYMRRKMDDGMRREIIVTIDAKSKQILRAIKNFYFDHQRPFVTWCYEQTLNSIYGNSLCYLLEPLHRAYTASVNQRLDAASLANHTLLVGRMGSQLGRHFRKNRVRPGYVEIAGDPKADVAQFDIRSSYTQLPELETKFLTHMSKLAAISDYNFGIEQISRPTATGQVQLIQEGQQPLFLLLESLRDALSDIAIQQMARYRQFYPDGLEVYLEIEGPEGQSVIEKFVTWPELLADEVLIETKVSSATMNKNMRRQEKLAMVDKLPQVYQTMMMFIQGAAQPGPMQIVSMRMLKAYQIIIDDFLEEFDIPRREEINPDFEQDLAIGQQIQQLVQQVQMLTMQNQQMQAAMGAGPGPGPGPGGPGPAGPVPGGQGPPPGAPPEEGGVPF